MLFLLLFVVFEGLDFLENIVVLAILEVLVFPEALAVLEVLAFLEAIAFPDKKKSLSQVRQAPYIYA